MIAWKGMTVHNRYLATLSFVVTITLLIVFLKVMNWLPLAVQQGTLRTYHSIEEVESKLHFSNIYVPSFFPQNFSWPPSEIIAQEKPFPMIIMQFRDRNTKSVGLVVQQVYVRARYRPETDLKITRIQRESTVLIKDWEAQLIIGFCGEGTACNQVSWESGTCRVTVRTTASPRELIRIARSMAAER